jgi:hypothetical protein
MVIPCLCSFSARIRGEIVRVLYRYHEKKSPDLFGLGTRGGELGTRTPDPLRVMHDDFSFFRTMIR